MATLLVLGRSDAEKSQHAMWESEKPDIMLMYRMSCDPANNNAPCKWKSVCTLLLSTLMLLLSLVASFGLSVLLLKHCLEMTLFILVDAVCASDWTIKLLDNTGRFRDRHPASECTICGSVTYAVILPKSCGIKRLHTSAYRRRRVASSTTSFYSRIPSLVSRISTSCAVRFLGIWAH
jgi:hypothetical protein